MNGLTDSSVGSAGVLAIAVLVALLVGRELAALAGPRFSVLSRNLAVLIAPLLVVFVLITADRMLTLVLQPPDPVQAEQAEPEADAPPPLADPGADETPGQAPSTLGADPQIAEVGPMASADATPVLLEETFGRPLPGWPDDPHGTAWFAERAYWLAAREARHFVAVGVPLPQVLRDLRVSARFRKQGGPPGGGYGLVVRDQGPGPRDGRNQAGRYYVLGVDDVGDVGIWRREEDHWVDIVPWRPAEAVRRGRLQANDLEASAEGGRLRLVVNGQEVASATDGLISAGGVGVFVGGDFNQVTLEHLEVGLPR